MINPFDLTKRISELVCRDNSKKYYRFRKTRFYGGCATADCLGCNLRCAYCWAQKKVWNPERFGSYYTDSEVRKKLTDMNLPLVRISGGEPTICKNHILKLLQNIPKNIVFILETNGIILNEEYINSLIKYKNLYVRVSLKGINKTTFEKITGAPGMYFKYQLDALKLLEAYNIKHGAAILVDLFTNEQIKKLDISKLEHETLIRYPFVMENLQRRGINIVR